MGLFRKKKRKKNMPLGGESTQELLGAEYFTQYGVKTLTDEKLFFTIQPVNISVMSPENIANKIHAFTVVLTTHPELEIFCTDANECFDSNKIYVKELVKKERVGSVREVLRGDDEFLDKMQTETATSRQFMLIYPLRGLKPEQVFTTANSIEKTVTDQGFEIKREGIMGIQRMTGNYLRTALNGDMMPLVDGGQYLASERKGR